MADIELTEKEKAFSSDFTKYDLREKLEIFDRLLALHEIELSQLSVHKFNFQDTVRLIAICRDNIC